MTDTAAPPFKTANPLIELAVTLIVPPFILMKLSDPQDLGAVNAQLLALAFPRAWGVRGLLREHKLNLFAALGMVSIVLTGGIGLLQRDTQWLAVREAVIPALIGLAVAVSALIMMAAFYFLARSIRELAGLKLTDAMKGSA